MQTWKLSCQAGLNKSSRQYAASDASFQSCKAEHLSEETWVAHDIDVLLVNASRSYEPYPENNVQALAAYLGAPNFFCGVNMWCSAGQPCSPVGIDAWYVLMAIQGWNNYVNNLYQALQYTSTILSLKLPKIVNDLWPKPRDDVTGIKRYIGWTNGILNAFPITAAFGPIAGGTASAIMGGNIILSGMLTPPATDQQYLSWSSISSQLGSFIETYKQAVTTYAERVINAPIDDPKFGINTVLRNGKFLTRGSNFTQGEFDRWMYKAISVNAIGSILQAQNVYVLRTFNITTCYDENPAILCQPAPNNKWTQYRLHKKGDRYEPIAGSTAKMLIETYGFTKEYILKGPADCFDANDNEQLTDPWEKNPPLGFKSDLQDMEPCNFNLNVCNYDMDEIGDYYAAREGWISALSPDDECGEQGINWV
ncbi:hypothetical protein LZ30DRAFT_749823 [Colletotrichum cereale]|nr:hypothetical protein LZ30DRAFT_749823 [Colletotrichum cereale]